MRFNNRLKRFALERGVLLSKAARPADIEQFIKRFRENYVSVDLIRIGGGGDGGYLLPDVLGGMKYCFSPGVSTTANFEQELSRKYNIKSFMADASVSSPPFEDENFFFTRKFLGSRSSGDFVTLQEWMRQNIGEFERGLILQMDIEGGEYDVLTLESSDTLERFSVMVIEFHFLDDLFDQRFLQFVTSVFEKIYRNFAICHVHPNNCCGILSLNDLEIPRIMEVTFLRTDLVKELLRKDPVSLPHSLDERNVPANADFVMPASWWRA